MASTRASSAAFSQRVWSSSRLPKLNVARSIVCQKAGIAILQPCATRQVRWNTAAKPTLEQLRKETTLSGPKSTPKPNVYNFAQIQEKISDAQSSEHILIDVREPSEYAAGYIPSAINIPVRSQPDALALTVEEFEDRFGFAKPDDEKEVIFYCKSGVRSAAAAQLAQQFGYKNVSEYPGSWGDWHGKGGKVARP